MHLLRRLSAIHGVVLCAFFAMGLAGCRVDSQPSELTAVPMGTDIAPGDTAIPNASPPATPISAPTVIAQSSSIDLGPTADLLLATQPAPAATARPTATPPLPPRPPATRRPAIPSPFEVLHQLPLIPGLDEELLLATQDGAVVLRTPSTGEETVLLEAGMYDLDNDNGLIPIIWPLRMAPSGEPRVLIATPNDGTWLVWLDGKRTQLSDKRLMPTWSPDGRSIAYTDNSPAIQFPSSGNVYVQDVETVAAPQLLTSLPGPAWNALWSPGCPDLQAQGAAGDCAGLIAVNGQLDNGLSIVVIDAQTGDEREVGSFRPPPIGGSLFYQWSADGRTLLAQTSTDTVAFSVDGGGAQAYAGVGPAADSILSSDGAQFARLIRDDPTARLVTGSVASGDEVEWPQAYPQVERVLWTADNRFVLLESYDCTMNPCGYRVWAVNPATGESQIAAEAVTLLGTVPMLQERYTEVAGPAGAITPVEDRAGGGPWQTYAVEDIGVQFEAPAGWEVDRRGSDFTVANFTVERPGGVVLSPEDVWIDVHWSDWYGNAPDYTNAQMLAELYYAEATEVVEIGDYEAARIRNRDNPVCDRYILNHRSGTVEIQTCPANEMTEAMIIDFLSRLVLLPGS